MGVPLIDIATAAGGTAQVLCAPNGGNALIEQIALDWRDDPLRPATIVVPADQPATWADKLAVVGRAAAAGAAGVVLIDDGDLEPVVAAATHLGVAVVRVARDGSERQVLDSMLLGLSFADASISDAEPAGGDLYGLSQVMAEVLGSPVTIDDPQWRLLAHSPCESASVDRLRIDFILERRPPPWFLEQLVVTPEYRVFRHGDDPVLFAETGDGYATGRLGIPIVAGRSFLGSVWAIDGELSTRATQSRRVKALQTQAAEILMQRRLEAGRKERRESQLVQTLTAGDDSPRDVLDGTVLAEASHCVVLVVEPLGASAGSSEVMDGVDLHRALQLARACWTGGLCAIVGRRVYGVVAVSGSRDELLREADWFVARVSRFGTPVRVSVGPQVDVPHANRSRDLAERALALPLQAGRAVIDTAAVEDELLLLELGRFARAYESRSPRLQQLLDHDDATGSELVPTIAAYLDSFGDVSKAARVLFVHPNTVRHRLERAVSVSGLDLTDPAQRLALQVQLAGMKHSAPKG